MSTRSSVNYNIITGEPLNLSSRSLTTIINRPRVFNLDDSERWITTYQNSYDNWPSTTNTPIYRQFIGQGMDIGIDLESESELEPDSFRVFTSRENVSDHHIASDFRRSVYQLLKDRPNGRDVRREINFDNILSTRAKFVINDSYNFSFNHDTENYLINFETILNKVWNRIENHQESREIKRILNQDLSPNKCSHGNCVRLVAALRVFYPDIEIDISENDQIANIIIAKRTQLEREERYSIEAHREESLLELTDYGHNQDLVREFVDNIE